MSDLKNSFGIRPYPRVAHYATGWAGERTFDEIYADLTPNLNRLLRYYGNADIDLPDLVAHAFMRLWLDLSANETYVQIKLDDIDRIQVNRMRGSTSITLKNSQQFLTSADEAQRVVEAMRQRDEAAGDEQK